MKARILSKIERQGPIKRSALLLEMNLHYPDLRDRKMRKLIEELIHDGHPISSSPNGYSVIKTREELTKAVNYLKAKSKAIAIRGNTLVGNFNLKYNFTEGSHQFSMEL